jgi:TIR domain
MMKLTMNGRTLNLGDLEKELMNAALEGAKDEMHERFGSIRHPDTNEFPTVRMGGDALDDVHAVIEGSPSLLEVVSERLSGQEREATKLMPVERIGPPQAFLSYSFDDRETAKKIAHALMAHGVATWWAEWEIQMGDSLRQKIDDGLSKCTHFLVLLTSGSIHKPWVNQEMDAGLVRRIIGAARFIPLRYGLSTKELPPLLSGMLSPEIGEDFNKSIRDLVNSIHDISRKPALGTAPAAVSLPQTGYSKAATAFAKVFVDESKNGEFGDPQKSIAELAESLDMSEEDVHDAIYELRDFCKESHGRVLVKSSLYAEFDKYFTQWNPEQDALRLAADLLNDEAFPRGSPEAAARYEWTPRRLNAAVTYLEDRKLIRSSQAMGTSPWVAFWIDATDATRRFVKSRS